MRTPLILLLTLLLTGCVISSPQKALYNAEYPHRQDIRQQNVYRFTTKPVTPGGEKYWGAGDLAQLFYVSDDKATTVELRFSYPGKSLHVASLDTQNHVLRERTFILLDESAAKPANKDIDYFFLTKEGELKTSWRSCIPDMSVGCSWGGHTLFITRNTDLAVQYETGGAYLMFLVFPAYGSRKYLEIFPQAPAAD